MPNCSGSGARNNLLKKNVIADLEQGVSIGPLLDLLLAVGLQQGIHGGDKPCHVAQDDADFLGQCMPVILIQLHRIRGESRWEDFIVEINHCHFDLMIIICL